MGKNIKIESIRDLEGAIGKHLEEMSGKGTSPESVIVKIEYSNKGADKGRGEIVNCIYTIEGKKENYVLETLHDDPMDADNFIQGKSCEKSLMGIFDKFIYHVSIAGDSINVRRRTHFEKETIMDQYRNPKTGNLNQSAFLKDYGTPEELRKWKAFHRHGPR